MVNYFNVLSHDDEDEDNSLLEDSSQVAVVTTKPTNNNINTSSSSEGIPTIPLVFNSKEKSIEQQHFEIQFDFNEHNQESTFSDTWVLWYDTKKDKSQTQQPDENSEYLQNIQKLGSFNNLKDLKALWEGINKPLDVNGNISIFKEGIEPAWEDNKNKDGGKYSVNYARDGHGDFSRVLNAWFTLITSIVYSSWEHYNQTNGAVLSVRGWGASINLWNDNSDNLDQVQSLKESFQNILRVKFCKFSTHRQSISKTSKSDDTNNNGINGLISKKKKIYNMNMNQLNMMNGYLSKNNSNINNNDLNVGSNSNSWIISGGNSKKKLSNSDESNTISIKKESLLSVRPNVQSQLPIQLQSNVSNNSSTQVVENTPAALVPEIPKGVNAWSTGILLGNPKSPETESEQQVEQFSINNHTNINDNTSNNNNNNDIEQQVEKQTSPQITKPFVVESTPVVVTTTSVQEIPKGVNAWSTGLLLPKPTVPVEPTHVENRNHSVVVERESKELKSENPNKTKAKKDSNLSTVNNNSTNELFWEDENKEEKQQPPVKPIREKKEKQQPVKEDKVYKEEKKDKFKKEEKKDKYSKVSKQQTPVSIWSNPSNNIVQLISTQPEPIEQLQTSSTSFEENKELSIVEPIEKVVKLEIKEAKKTVEPVIAEVVKKTVEEWTSIPGEKKPKKPKNQVDSNTTTGASVSNSSSKSTEPKDKILFRNLLVEEPTAYPSPIKPTLKKDLASTSGTTTATTNTLSHVNKKKDSKDSKDKDSKKQKDSKEPKKSISTKPTTLKQQQQKQLFLVTVFLSILGFIFSFLKIFNKKK